MATSPLADLTYYANRSQGGVGMEDVNSDRGRAALLAAQQYDPGASWRPVYGSDGQSLGFTLDFDASKLPGSSGTGSLGGTSGHGSGADYQIPFSTVQPNMQLGDPNAVTNSPAYGRITDNTNINQPSSALDYLGPAAVAAFAFGVPYLASSMSGGALGAGASGAAAGALDTGGDSYLGLTNDGFPAFQGVPGTDFPALDTSGDGYLGLSGVDTQPAAPIVENGTAARVGDVIRNGGVPGLDNVASSLRGINLGNVASALGKLPPGLLSNGAPGGGGGPGGPGAGGGLLGRGATDDALAVLKAFYGDPSLTGAKYLARQRGLL